MIINNFLNVLHGLEKNFGRRIPIREFSRLTGISTLITSNLYHDRTKSINYDTLDKLVKFFNLPPSAFLKYYSGHLTFKLTNATAKQIHNVDLPVNLTSRNNYHPAVLLSCQGFNPVFFIMPLKPFIIHDRFNHQQIMDIPLFYTNVGKYSTEQPLRHDKYMIKVINDFNTRFCQYITSRIILHGGLISKSDKIHKYNIDISEKMDYSDKIKDTSLYIQLTPHLPLFTSDPSYLMKIYKKQPTRNKHRVLKSDTGKPIKLYDYTTNNFAK